jgi:hypothetical protein
MAEEISDGEVCRLRGRMRPFVCWHIAVVFSESRTLQNPWPCNAGVGPHRCVTLNLAFEKVDPGCRLPQ